LLFGAVEQEFGLARNLSRRDVEQAEVAVEKLAAVGRDSPYARIEVGVLAAQAGDLERSVSHLEAGVRLYPTVSGFMRLGEILAARGDKEAAIEAFENALAIDPVNEEAMLRLALACAEMGETARARELLRASGSGGETWLSGLRQRVLSMLES
jgi:tetratricopeptide (TPR) repeat protein